MEMTPYTCGCCGGRIDVSTMRCMYCDTQYHHPSLERLNIVKVEPGVHSLRGEVRIPREVMMHADPEAIRDRSLDELKHQMADGLLAFLKISTCIDPMSNTEIIRGEVRVVDPMFDSYRKMGDVATANEIRQFYGLKPLQDEVSAEKIRNEVIRAMRGVEHIRR